jgi:hypothetical protein
MPQIEANKFFKQILAGVVSILFFCSKWRLLNFGFVAMKLNNMMNIL